MAWLEKQTGSDEYDAILIGGGDGSVSAAAQDVWKNGKTLIVLPAGTMNMFARSLQIPLDLDQAINALAAGRIDKVDIATANGRAFLHQISFGFHAEMVEIRDRMAFNSRLQKIFASVKASLETLFSSRGFKVYTTMNGARTRHRLSAMSVSNNLFGEGHLPYADRLDGGVLGVYMAHQLSSVETAKAMAAMIAGRAKTHLTIDVLECERITLEFRAKYARTAKMVLDGELLDLPESIDCMIHKQELSVVVPQVAIRPTLTGLSQ